MGYKFQFVTLAGFHALNLGMFDLARSYKQDGMLAYSKFQELEFEHERVNGYMATTHQKFVGTGYFDRVVNCVSGGDSSVQALSGSTEEEQF
jgi:isocitrate lyase